MRLHRLTLRSYRGVAACELTFAEGGITVVEGDNEAGKSSAAEALHLLLEYRDDSSHRRVTAVKPLHHDVGAEVEAELSAGPLRFTYTKRWHRDRATRLRITSPRAEVVTGRAAHDRVRALLAETVDLELWRALSAPQGGGFEQPSLRDHPSLVAALDAVAGGALGTPEEGDLLQRAATEAGRWFTATGRPKAALADLRLRAAGAAAAVAQHEAAIGALEADVTWCADVERRITELEPKLTVVTAAAADAAAAATALRERHAAVEGLGVAARLAGTEADLARGAVGARAGLVDGVAAAEGAVAEAADAEARAIEAVEGTAAALTEAEGLEAAARGEAHAAGAAVASAEAAHAELGRAATWSRMAGQVAELEAVLARAERLQADLTRDEQALAANPSSPQALAAVHDACDDALRARAALDAAGASVQVEALGDLDVVVDGSPEQRQRGGVTRHAVVDHLVVEVPGRLRVTVTAGEAVDGLRARHEAALGALAERCARLGVVDVAGARALEDRRRDLVAAVARSRAALASELEGRDVERLVALVDQAREVLADAGPAPEAAPTPEELDAARARWDESCRVVRLSQRSADRAADRSATAREAVRAEARAQEQAAAARATAQGTLERRLAVLEDARASASDAALCGAAEVAAADAGAAVAVWRDAADEVDGDELRGAVQAAQRTAVERDGVARSLAAGREELAGIRSRLELQGEGGLHDGLAEAQRLEAAVLAELRSVEDRARAALLLLTTLTCHRDQAARAYGAPLRTELERLGALVFGPGFAVELDDELRISSRVLDGDPVPWSELSVGAREQLAVLTRLAVATLVSPDGGVPVVFDDVLGFTDPGRLALMAAAFESAAERCQIIVLTCDPGRYRHLARATTHCLARPREVGARQAG